MPKMWTAFVAVAASGFVLAVGSVAALREVSHEREQRDCSILQETSGMQTKFVEHSYLAWDCLIKAKGNRWAKVTP